MKNINLKSALSSVLLLVAGVFLLLKPGETLDLIVKLVGVALLAVGALGVAQFFLKKDKKNRSILHLLISVVEIVGGLVFLVKPGYIVSVYYVFAGIIILLNGISNLSVAFDMKKAGFDRWAAAVILSVIAILAGIIIIFNPFAAATTVIRFIGVALAYDGVVGILLMLYLATEKK